MEQIMLTDGPSALLPLQDMQAANREHWISIYTRKGASGPVLPKLAGTTWNGSVNVASLQDIQRWYLGRGEMTAEVDLSRAVDASFADYAVGHACASPRQKEY